MERNSGTSTCRQTVPVFWCSFHLHKSGTHFYSKFPNPQPLLLKTVYWRLRSPAQRILVCKSEKLFPPMFKRSIKNPVRMWNVVFFTFNRLIINKWKYYLEEEHQSPESGWRWCDQAGDQMLGSEQRTVVSTQIRHPMFSCLVVPALHLPILNNNIYKCFQHSNTKTCCSQWKTGILSIMLMMLYLYKLMESLNFFSKCWQNVRTLYTMKEVQSFVYICWRMVKTSSIYADRWSELYICWQMVKALSIYICWQMAKRLPICIYI